MITGYYYLHDNGELIYKPGTDCVADIRESDLARALWPLDPDDRAGAWAILIEGLSLGAKKDRIEELSQKWKCDNADADIYADRVGCNLTLDGNAWCATRMDFSNLQESPAGFGDTKLEAMAELCRELGYKACKMWGSSFQELLSLESLKKGVGK